MKVLRIKNKGQANKLLYKRGNARIVPVHDANGDLVIPVESMNDPAFEDLADDMLDKCEIVDYVPALDNTVDTLRQQGKLVEFILPAEDTPRYVKPVGVLKRIANFFGL